MYDVTPLPVSPPSIPFDMTPLVALRQPLALTPVPIAPAIVTAIRAISAQHAQVDFHVSSHTLPSAHLTYPVTADGLRYGTISHALPPPPDVTQAVFRREFRRLVAECRDLLQFLDLVQWQRWQRRQDADRRREPPTPRERDILLHCFMGHSRWDIAQRLQITPMTVKRHLCTLYEKLGVHSMQEALAVGRAAGLFLHLL